MLLNPAIIALLFGSLVMTGFALYAAGFGIQIIRNWDLASGSEQQLSLEKKTYLISTIFSYLLGFQLLSLFLFIYTAEHLHTFFVGAMCAAGSLNVNGFGYPTLLAKIIGFLLCGIWLIVNYTDYQAFDYPLIRQKYTFLLAIAGWLVLETLLQTSYFLHVKADVITSCCGSLFSETSRTVAADVAALPPYGTKIAFYLAAVITARLGLSFYLTGSSPHLFSYSSTVFFLVSLASIVSFVSPYIYELPTHHCPFCLLQKEYSYVGYPLYAALLTGGISGASTGLLNRFKHLESLRSRIPQVQKTLCLITMVCYTALVGMVSYPLLFSDFTLG